MTSHAGFSVIGTIVLLCWMTALIGYLPIVAKRLRYLGPCAFALGWLLILVYMGWLWHMLDRPPMRTQGETRLWYTIFLPFIGLVVEWRWKSRMLAIPTLGMALVFLILTLTHPESLDKSMMPALDSPWFAPHVIVYMVSYATLGIAAAVAAWGLGRNRFSANCLLEPYALEVRRLVYIGFPLMTTGLILGAFWAQIAWGRYWTWDPKETWAFITWMAYLAFLHLDRYRRLSARGQLWIVLGAFVILLGCWFGVNYLPSAMGSVHSYAR